MMSGCIFKIGAPTQGLRKVCILTRFGLCYAMRENVKIRKMQISFILYIYWPSYPQFSMRCFLLTSVYVEEGLYYPCSGNKGADQLCSYCTAADLRLCFRIGNNPIFTRCGSTDHRHNIVSIPAYCS